MRPFVRTPLLAATLMLVACSQAPTPVAPAPAATPPSAPAAAPAPAATATPAATAIVPAGEDWELPGTLGPMTTQAELEARFGKANVREETLPGAEGESAPALVVFADDPSRRLELVLDAGDKEAPIQLLRVSGVNSRWHDGNGLHPGMSLGELVNLNGAPVSFYGLGWDYGGSVQDWHGGRLANAVGVPLFRAVTLVARPGTPASAELPQGDRIFRSDDDRSRPAIEQTLVVGELSISWPGDAE